MPRELLYKSQKGLASTRLIRWRILYPSDSCNAKTRPRQGSFHGRSHQWFGTRSTCPPEGLQSIQYQDGTPWLAKASIRALKSTYLPHCLGLPSVHLRDAPPCTKQPQVHHVISGVRPVSKTHPVRSMLMKKQRRLPRQPENACIDKTAPLIGPLSAHPAA